MLTDYSFGIPILKVTLYDLIRDLLVLCMFAYSCSTMG